MSTGFLKNRLNRRGFLKGIGGAAVALAGAQLVRVDGTNLLRPIPEAEAAPSAVKGLDVHLAATDGWVYLPGSFSPWHPDPLAPAPRTTYIFGFRNVTGLTDTQVSAEKNRAQIAAPILWMDEGTDNTINLTNLGLSQRPDLVDSHTVHFHGFRNAIPIFDGVPEMSVSVPIGRSFPYFYRPRDPGTYMYHCHFEDVEHVQMGMTGVVFVRPAQNKTPLHAGEKYVYNDGDGSTRYDREFVMFLSEVWAEAHFRDAHIQLSDWSDYKPDFWLLNGRVYPDTMQPNGDPMVTPPAGSAAERLRYQPQSSLVTANSGDSVLLRVVSLGYQQAAMTLAGIPMRVVGKDATLLRGRDGTATGYSTNTVYLGPGEAYDVIFKAPAVTSPTTYLFYNRALANLSTPGSSGLGGQMTEVRIYPAGTLPPQTAPNT